MRHKISWSDLTRAPVGVWGAGVEGVASIRKLRSIGIEPAVVVDDRPAGIVEGLTIVATVTGGLEALAHCSVVIKTPGISRYRTDVEWLESQGVRVVSGLGLWLQEADRRRVVCVTGTKGKSTTVSIVGHLLRHLGYSCFVGGNLGQPPFDPDVPDKLDFWIIETSSFQATDVFSGPATVAVTSLHPDHLDWHRGVDAYYRDKLSLCSRPGVELTIVNGEDATLRAYREYLGSHVEWVTATGLIPTWVLELNLLGRHNQLNALIARSCVEALGVAAPDDLLVNRSGRLEPLPSRLEIVGVVNGVTFVDDSLSTNVLSTNAAVSVFNDRRVALLVGGYDRQIDYAELHNHLRRRETPTLVLGLPDSGERIVAAIEGTTRGSLLEGRPCKSLIDAVQQGFQWASPDGIVLLSPAAASFGRFRDFKDRAVAFRNAMERLRSQQPTSPG